MKKKLAPLILTLVLCVSLAVPASAGGTIRRPHCMTNDTGQFITYLDQSSSGKGWSFDLDSYTLTLDGFEGAGLVIHNTPQPLTLKLADGSVNTLTSAFRMEDTSGLIITGNGTLSIQSNNNYSIDVTDDITIKSGTIKTNEKISVSDSLTVSGGLVSSTAELDIQPNSRCTVTDGGMILLDTANYAVHAAGGADAVTGLESATIVGKNGEPLSFQSVDSLTVLCDAAGNVAPYAKITAGGNAAQPEQPQQPATPASGTAYASTQNVLVDGKTVEFPCYALKDANGNDTNYVKLRDVAYVLNGTSAQFQVGWDQAASTIALTTGAAYSSNGTEMSTPYSGDRAYEAASSAVTVNGQTAALDAILLKDDSGNGYTYFKLRDLGTALGFTVDWSAERGIYIETK